MFKFNRNRNRKDQLRTPWVMRLPVGLQSNTAVILISVLMMVLGIAAVTGFSDPKSITSEMSLPFYRIMGALLALAGAALMYGIVVRDFIIEKFSARLIALACYGMGGWAITANGIRGALITTVFGLSIAAALEHRISLINVGIYAERLAKRHLGQQKADSEDNEK